MASTGPATVARSLAVAPKPVLGGRSDRRGPELVLFSVWSRLEKASGKTRAVPFRPGEKFTCIYGDGPGLRRTNWDVGEFASLYSHAPHDPCVVVKLRGTALNLTFL